MSESKAQLIIDTRIELDGDAGELLHAVGTAEALPGLSAVLAGRQKCLAGVDGLRTFLSGYVHEILLPVELPTVLSAWEAAEEGHLRDLMRLDLRLCADPRLEPFRAASCAVGRRQLNKLRPLRDQRFVQRYRQAMETGEAAAWHTIVYGIVLALYSLPLRDGLQHLALQTMAGFALNAAPEFGLRLNDCRDCLQDVAADLPDKVNGVLANTKLDSVNLFNSARLKALP
jgi:urease accessory protein UreF